MTAGAGRPTSAMPDRLAALLARPRIAFARRALDRYLAVGGGTLAGGLAYALLFGLLTLLLAAGSIAALALDDAARRAAVVEAFATLLPPLAPYVADVLAAVASGAIGLSLSALFGLTLGGVRFYLTLENCLALLFHDQPKRSPWATLGRALLVPPLLAFAIGGLLLAGGPLDALLGVLELPEPLSPLLALALDAGPLLIAIVALAAAYRYVPSVRPPTRATWLVSGVVALALGLLGGLYGLLSPWLLGNLAIYGAPLAVVLGIIYLQLVATAILLGGALLAERTTARGVGLPSGPK